MAHPDGPRQDPGPEAAPWLPDLICPLCGRTGPAFDQQVSAALDQLEVLEAVVHDVKGAVQALAP